MALMSLDCWSVHYLLIFFVASASTAATATIVVVVVVVVVVVLILLFVIGLLVYKHKQKDRRPGREFLSDIVSSC